MKKIKGLVKLCLITSLVRSKLEPKKFLPPPTTRRGLPLYKHKKEKMCRSIDRDRDSQTAAFALAPAMQARGRSSRRRRWNGMEHGTSKRALCFCRPCCLTFMRRLLSLLFSPVGLMMVLETCPGPRQLLPLLPASWTRPTARDSSPCIALPTRPAVPLHHQPRSRRRLRKRNQPPLSLCLRLSGSRTIQSRAREPERLVNLNHAAGAEA